MHHGMSASRDLSRSAGRVVTRFMLSTALVGGTLLAATPVAGAQPPPAANPAVITTWNAVALTTISGPPPNGAGKANAEAFLGYAFTHAAIYNAVVGITGEYELYNWDARAPKGASPEAAAAAAAHRVLMEYFGTTPTIVANLDAALAASLGQIPDGVPKEQGVRYGERAADRIITLRANDGRFAPITYVVPIPTPPGVWRPTPPAFAPFFDPWLGQVDPVVIDSLSQFDPGPPPAINTDLYVQELEEVRDWGAKEGSLRGPDEKETALFFSDIAFGPLQAALRELATRRALNISDSARLFAAVETSLADGAGSAWHWKLLYAWWRPITAIREADTDGNPDTTGVPTWEPLLVTPPYPDWPSGLCTAIGVMSTSLSRLNGDGMVDLTITSPAAMVTRHYNDPALLQQDCIDARVWSGIHFRTADIVAAAMGSQVANWALDHHFAPTR
jgi:hypothetical protein